jgi:hypothetical protein
MNRMRFEKAYDSAYLHLRGFIVSLDKMRQSADTEDDALHKYTYDAAKALKESLERYLKTAIHNAITRQDNPPMNPLVVRCCSCEWKGSINDTVHPKHEPNHLLCPKCLDVAEKV